MTVQQLKEHSDKRDDIIEKKLDEINKFIHNGLSEKIIQGITDYLDRQMAKKVRLFCKVFFTALTVALVSCIVRVIFL